MHKRLLCVVHGKVQGVTYRDFTRRAAKGLGLAGYVQNLTDGTVEVVAEGEETSLQELLRLLHGEHPWARVERIDEKWGDATGEYSDFRIL